MTRRRGFTLIELLVVIAILATIAGGILVSYDGLETDAAEGMSTFNLAGVDRAVRTYKTLNKTYPDNLDSLMVAGTNEFCAILPAKLQGADGSPTTDATTVTDDGKLAFHTLTAQGAAALNNVGITTLRAIASSAGNTQTPIPNRVFDPAAPNGEGLGTSMPVVAGTRVAIVETVGIGTGDDRLQNIAGLDRTKQHIVVALGLGNSSTMVAGSGIAGSLSEAPFYTKVAKHEYGRFLLLFHLGTDEDASGTVDAAEYFSEARFLAVIDTRGDWIDEEYAEFTNQAQ
jgi:prepilin-type N-terminal cleavage/methylation domain-containing protein